MRRVMGLAAFGILIFFCYSKIKKLSDKLPEHEDHLLFNLSLNIWQLSICGGRIMGK